MRPIFPLVFIAFVACEGPTPCTEEAIASVSVTVVDAAAGTTLPSAFVSYTLDGGAAQTCDALGEGAFACGWEQAGDFAIDVSYPGYASERRLVSVEPGTCHVAGEALTVALNPENLCLDDAMRPSLIVRPLGVGWSEEGWPLPDAIVTYAVDDGPWQACEPFGEAAWSCGWEQTGHFFWRVEAEGYGPAEGELDIGRTPDGCHVQMQEIEPRLDCLAC